MSPSCIENLFTSETMSLVLETCTPIDNLVQSSLSPESKHKLEWIPCSQITNIEPTQMDNVYHAIRKRTGDNDQVRETTIMLLCLGSNDECTPTLVSEFARIYSLPTHKYNNDNNQFKRYNEWLIRRNMLIRGFTNYDNNYYMVADRKFYDCYSLYGFCSKCGILRCSPVWCICGHKELRDGWTSNNKQLDEFIKKSQLQTKSPNEPYLEWIPYDCIYDWLGYKSLYGLPTYEDVKLIPLEITDETHDLYYAEVNYLLICHVYLNNY